LLASAFVLVFCVVFNTLVFERVPHFHDEIATLFQAKIFAAGKLVAPSPCAKESFDFPHIINNGRWYSIYPPGFPVLLLPGLLVKAPWLVNPLLASLAVILFFILGREIYDRPTGIISAWLGATSIWLLLMSSTMMSHTASMLLNALFLLFIFRSLRTPTVLNGLLAGASLGLAFLVRPLNAAFFSLPFLIVCAAKLFRDFKGRGKNTAALVTASATFVFVLLAYNFLTNGQPLKMGYVALYGKAYTVVFGRPATLDYDYTPLFAGEQLFDNLKALNSYLFGWPFSSFLALLPLAWVIVRSEEEKKKALLLLAAFVSLLIGFYFFWGAFTFIGARMFFESIPVLVLLSARGIRMLPSLIASKRRKSKPETAKKVVAAVLTVFLIYAFGIRFPRWLWPAGAAWHYDRYDHNLAGTTARLQESIRRLEIRNALVITKFLYGPIPGFPTGQWGSGFLHNEPSLEGEIIYALDRGEQNIELLSCFPDRVFYKYLGTLEKGMLIPMRTEGGKLVSGQPVSLEARCKKCLEIIDSPVRFFRLYSAEFKDFIEEFFREHSYLNLDVPYLLDLGRRLIQEGDCQKAAFCLEAGLQIENNPRPRYQLLSSLLKCYLRLGRAEEAGRVEEVLRLASFDEKRMYFVFPDKGF